MKIENKDFFWPSYVDLMTALFIVMLVLFVLSYKSLNDAKKTSEEKLKKIEEVQKAVSGLPENVFIYEPAYKRYTLTKQIQYERNSAEIPMSDYEYLTTVGNEINKMIGKLKDKYNSDSIKYLIVIEGMASKIGGTEESNYLLSYLRARSIYEFWKNRSINFDPEICEVMLSGSGLGGVGRFSGQDEFKNQRILIQIVPKLSKFKANDASLKASVL
jgi:outer membrane protein OmpA-like peptidoglycan-associated protein